MPTFLSSNRTRSKGTLALVGNTFFPILLRWTIILLNRLARDDSSRKVYFRYLLINGRSHYSHLFTSQETWLLLFVQITFLSFQALWLNYLGEDVNMNKAIFESINTRKLTFIDGSQSIFCRHQILLCCLSFSFLDFLHGMD